MQTLLLMLAIVLPGAGVEETYPDYDRPSFGDVRALATGFFQVEQIDGRWWVVDPNGHGFYIIGTDHIRYDGHGCEALGYAPYGKVVREKYENEQAWADATVKRLKAWGFNTLAAGHSESLRHKGLPHTEFLALGTAFARQEALCPPGTWTGFPNVFSPEWPEFCEKTARDKCVPNREDPWLIGYFLDNELEWYGKIWLPYGLFHEAWKLPAEHTGKQAWIAFVKERLDAPAEMEQHWGVRAESWGALANHVEPNEPLTDDARAMAVDWVNVVAERYFAPAVEAIRKHDPNHLVLGCRFAGPSPGAWAPAGKHCDIVSFNYYADIDVQRGVPHEVVEMFREWQLAAGAPMMITEWSFPSLDTELPSTNGAGMRVDNQRQRTQCFRHFQRTMFKLPFMVGSDFFMYIDEPELGIAAAFPENSNYGLVSNADEPYPQLTRAAAEVNVEACRLHAKGTVSIPTAEERLVPWLRTLPKRSDTIPASPITLDTGNLVLEGPMEGHAWRMMYDGRLLGHIAVLINQRTPHSRWEGSRTAKITAVRKNDHVTVVDMELAGGHGDPAADAGSPTRAFRTGWRFWIPRRPASAGEEERGEWFVSQCLWVESADTEPWTLARVVHALSPSLGGSAEGDVVLEMGVQRYHRRGGGWIDPQAGLGVGMWLPPEWQFYYNFWRGEDGTFHTDVHFDPYITLAPGQRYEEPTGRRVFVFPLTALMREGFAEHTYAIEGQAFLPAVEQ